MEIHSFEFNYFGVNTYLVWDKKSSECAIIDPGMINQQENEALIKFISSNNLTIKYLLNTHLHIDHLAGDDFVEEYYGVRLSAHKADEFLSLGRESQIRMFHLKQMNASPLAITHYLKNGDKLYLGEEYLDVIEVPGHSPGSVAFYCPSSHFVITGDALFEGSIGRTDLPGGDMGILINSIRNKLLILPPKTIVYPGHGGPTTIGNEIQNNPFLSARR